MILRECGSNPSYTHILETTCVGTIMFIIPREVLVNALLIHTKTH